MLLYSACDPGSRVTHKQDGNTCWVTLESFFPESDGLVVEMELTCESEGENCYEITYLSCRGEEKIDAVPIDLRITDGGPASGDPWCLAKCSDAGAQLWNMVPLTARVRKLELRVSKHEIVNLSAHLSIWGGPVSLITRSTYPPPFSRALMPTR